MSRTLEQEDRLFPVALLQAGTNERLKYFASETIVQHHRLSELADEIELEAFYPGEASIIGLIGPTGVGKSTLLRIIEYHMRRWMQSRWKWTVADFNISVSKRPEPVKRSLAGAGSKAAPAGGGPS